MNYIFNSLPLPYYILILIALVIFDIYYIIKIRNSPTKFMLFPLIFMLITALLLIATKCVQEWATGTILENIFTIIQSISILIVLISIIFMGINRYRKNYAKGTKKTMLLVCSCLLVLIVSFLFAVYVITRFF